MSTSAKIVSFIVLLAVVIIFGLVWYFYRPLIGTPNTSPEETICTKEARLCSDGSYVGRTGSDCSFAPCPGQNPNTTTNNWEKQVDSKNEFSFFYPPDFGKAYITPVDWPPEVSVTTTTFSCEPAGNETDRAGKTEERLIGGSRYCVTTIKEGAAGSVYTQYAYTTTIQNNRLGTFTFSLREPQCLNYDEPEQGTCQAGQADFSPDVWINTIVDSIESL